jgi:hypothetical protein
MNTENTTQHDNKFMQISNYEGKWAKIYYRGSHVYLAVLNFNPFKFPDFINSLDKKITKIKTYGEADMGVLFLKSKDVYGDIGKSLYHILGELPKNVVHQGTGTI